MPLIRSTVQYYLPYLDSVHFKKVESRLYQVARRYVHSHKKISKDKLFNLLGCRPLIDIQHDAQVKVGSKATEILPPMSDYLPRCALQTCLMKLGDGLKDSKDNEVLPWFIGKVSRHCKKVLTNIILGIYPEQCCNWCLRMYGKQLRLSTNHVLRHVGFSGSIVVDRLLEHRCNWNLALLDDFVRWYEFCCSMSAHPRSIRHSMVLAFHLEFKKWERQHFGEDILIPFVDEVTVDTYRSSGSFGPLWDLLHRGMLGHGPQ